jgi:hypothetical protein
MLHLVSYQSFKRTLIRDVPVSGRCWQVADRAMFEETAAELEAESDKIDAQEAGGTAQA